MITQLNKKQLKQIQNQSQSGRSMVEMLGVLAIIAILSIGGIIGFRLAMNYYQANQIAHEMNIMRTDAQIKIAQGAEKLTLGSPYDENKINFNDYGTDFGCIYMENENAEPSPAFCTAANAYYIELKEIPEGVCKPLANLIDNMDNEIAFYINEKSVDAEGEKGACGEGSNTLKVIFGADSDSEAIKCNDEGDPECPAELPVCLNHVCVECKTYHDCQGEKPQCDEISHTCKSCYELEPNKPLWNGNECVECTANAQCLERGKDPYCNKETYRCESCPDGGTYEEEYNACVIHIPTEFFLDGAWVGENFEKAQPKCKKITSTPFGPYEHSYEIWGHGTMDDCIKLYVNSDPDTSDVTQCTTGFRAQKCCCGEGKCMDYCSDFSLGELNAGEYGNLVVHDKTAYHSWGMSWVEAENGNPPRNDGDIWLILKEE